jgi:hypothetical protein
MATGRTGARPKVVSGGAREEAILNALRTGCTRRAAAAVGGISTATFYRMLESETFQDAVEKAEGEAEATFTAAVAAAVPKSWQAAAWWLERRKHMDFAQHSRIDMNVDLRGEAQRIASADGLDADELIAEAERIVNA